MNSSQNITFQRLSEATARSKENFPVSAQQRYFNQEDWRRYGSFKSPNRSVAYSNEPICCKASYGLRWTFKREIPLWLCSLTCICFFTKAKYPKQDEERSLANARQALSLSASIILWKDIGNKIFLCVEWLSKSTIILLGSCQHLNGGTKRKIEVSDTTIQNSLV